MRAFPSEGPCGEPAEGAVAGAVVDTLEPVAANYAADRPARGHRKVHWLMAADGHAVSRSSVERALRRRGLLQPIDYTGERRELARARRAAFAAAPTRPNEVWQLDFSEYETTSGGIWRIAGVTDYFTKIEHGWHIPRPAPAPTPSKRSRSRSARPNVSPAGRWAEALPADPDTGQIQRIKLVTDNGAWPSAANNQRRTRTASSRSYAGAGGRSSTRVGPPKCHRGQRKRGSTERPTRRAVSPTDDHGEVAGRFSAGPDRCAAWAGSARRHDMPGLGA
jgi:hypothetical protein